jgi:hypothetical protein
MYTLFVLCFLYTFFALKIFKKHYGSYNIFDKPPKLYTVMVLLSTAYLLIAFITFILTHCP